MIVSCLVDLHNKYSHSKQYSDPTGKLWQVIVGILSFVYDCNLSNTGAKHKTVKDVLQRTQHDAQLWNDFIQASGARIELSKCFTQIIDFKFSLCGVSAVGRLQKNLHLELINCTTSQKVQINPISSCSTYWSLRTVQDICPNQTIQLDKLKKKAIAHTCALVSTSITSAQAWIHHMMCFVPYVGYPLRLCHLNDSQLHSLQSNYIMVLNNKLGFQKRYAHNVVFGP